MSGAERTDVGADTHPTADPSTAEPSTARQPLTSLSSLLGGPFDGGQACDVDGSCD